MQRFPPHYKLFPGKSMIQDFLFLYFDHFSLISSLLFLMNSRECLILVHPEFLRLSSLPSVGLMCFLLSWGDQENFVENFSFTSSLVILVKLLPDNDILEKAVSGKLDEIESLNFFIFLLPTGLNLEESKHLRFDLNISFFRGSIKYWLWWPPAGHWSVDYYG